MIVNTFNGAGSTAAGKQRDAMLIDSWFSLVIQLLMVEYHTKWVRTVPREHVIVKQAISSLPGSIVE
jgi:hypothetical protein